MGLIVYRWLLWQLLRLSEAQGGDQGYRQVRKAGADTKEGFAKKPGALFVSRPKGARG